MLPICPSQRVGERDAAARWLVGGECRRRQQAETVQSRQRAINAAGGRQPVKKSARVRDHAEIVQKSKSRALLPPAGLHKLPVEFVFSGFLIMTFETVIQVFGCRVVGARSPILLVGAIGVEIELGGRG